MTEATEAELRRTRLRFLDLCKSFFAGEPDAARIGRWRGIFSALRRERINPAMDAAILTISRQLEEKNLELLSQEHYRLFVDPFVAAPISLSLSHYRDQRSHGPVLAEFRGFLDNIGIERKKGFVLAEDSLLFMLDCLAAMVEMERDNHGRKRGQQAELLRCYLLPLGSYLVESFEQLREEGFFSACACFLVAYLELDYQMIDEMMDKS